MSRYLNSKKVINNSKCMVNNMSNRSIECKPTINSLYQTSLICDYVPNCEDVVVSIIKKRYKKYSLLLTLVTVIVTHLRRILLLSLVTNCY